MRLARKTILLVLCGWFASTLHLYAATPVGTAVKEGQADMRQLPDVATFSLQAFDSVDHDSHSGDIVWTVRDTNRDGVVDHPLATDASAMNNQKWMWANHHLKLTFTVTQSAWALQVYTDNRRLESRPPDQAPYQYQLQTPSKNGLVGENGQHLLPLVWRVVQSTKTMRQTCSSKGQDLPRFGDNLQMCEVENRANHELGFLGSDTHFMGDLGDATTQQIDTPGSAWWENRVPTDPKRFPEQLYHAVLYNGWGGFSDGDNHVTAQSPVHVYMGAQFSDPMSQLYRTVVFFELYSH